MHLIDDNRALVIVPLPRHASKAVGNKQLLRRKPAHFAVESLITEGHASVDTPLPKTAARAQLEDTMIKHILPKRLETIAHMPSPMTAEKGLGLLSTIGGSVRMLREMRRADPILAARLPLPKECQSAINTAKIRVLSITVV